jgi:dipeptidyl aminopeptidase/acylaminoacyl peptidase
MQPLNVIILRSSAGYISLLAMHKTLKFSAAALAISAALSSPVLARPMTAEDLATMKRLAAPALSPDGKLAVYQLRETDMAANKGRTDLYLLSVDDKTAVPVKIASKPDKNEHDPVFSPDGKSIYYISNESGSDQIWRVATSGGNPVIVSKFKNDVGGFKISPDAKKIAIWGDVAVDCFGLDCDHDGDRSKPGPGSGREYDALFVRHWDSWETPGNHSRIFTYGMNADGTLYGGGHPLDEQMIKPGEGEKAKLIGDAPSKPFGGGEEVAWSADSENVYYAMRIADRDEPLSTNLDIYSSHQNYDTATNETPNNKATDTLPATSPDGRYLAWAAMARAGYEADRQVLMLRDLKTDKVTSLTQKWDRSVGSINWAPDSKNIYVTANEVLDNPVFKIDLTGKVTRLTGAGHVSAVMPRADGSIIYAMDGVRGPSDLYLRDTKGKVRQLTQVNVEMAKALDPVAVQRFSFKGAGGDTVWGQITKPVGSAGKLPVAFVVHGGPQGSFGDSWSFRWNPRVMAAQGYAVVSIDFHGSTGYGQAFTDSIQKDWGGKPLEDLKIGLAEAAKIDPQVDDNNACALGASYGGYMMNWIAGVWPDKFKCIVQHDGVFDLRAMAFETEELWFDEWDHGGPWWQRQDPEKWNPVGHVTKWKTPMLVITSEKDFRIPYTQGLAAFTALQRQGIESKLLVFPDENHWVLKPKNSVQWHNTVFGWMAKYLKKE